MTVINAASVDEVLRALRDHPGAALVQGGTDLMVEVNLNRRSLNDVVSLRRVNELRRWHVDEDGRTLYLGAGVPYAEMERPPLREYVPALAEAARTVGSPQIRAAGSLGGNLGTCSPAGDGLPVLSALDAVVRLQSVDSVREMSVHDFMLGVKKNARRPDELIVGVTLPIVSGYQGYAKVGTRNAMVISAASACLVHDLEKGSVRVALGAVGTTVVRARSAESFLAEYVTPGAPLRLADDVINEFARRASGECAPIDDHRSTAAYRRHAVRVLVERLLRRAVSHTSIGSSR